MKRLLITLLAMSFLLADPSPVGNWKLSGLEVEYTQIARENASLVLNDAYGFGVSVPVLNIPSGALFYTQTSGPYTMEGAGGLHLIGVDLNVNVYPDGTGAIAVGSNYPDINLADGQCATELQVLPVSDTFSWETAEGATAFSTQNIVGLASINDHAGETAYGFGLSESSTFDDWPAVPTPERIPDGLPMVVTTEGVLLAASCETAVVGAACGQAGFDPATQLDACIAALMAGGAWDGVVSQVTACEMDTNPAYGGSYAGSANWGGAGWLHGSHASGYFNVDMGDSGIENNVDSEGNTLPIDFLLQWNGIDGPITGSGYGDIDYPLEGWDEEPNYPDAPGADGPDGEEFDRVFGFPAIPVTNVTQTCPLLPNPTLPVAGDLTGEVSNLVLGQCLDGVAAGAEEGCYGAVLAGVYDGCLDSVEDAVEGQCDDAGGPANAVTGVCYGASQTDEFAGACAYYGADAALTMTCVGLGFSEDICAQAASQASPAIDAYCVYATGVDCATAGIDPCTVLTNSDFAMGLCGTLAGGLTCLDVGGASSEDCTCDYWAGTFDDDFLNAQAATDPGTGYMTCSDLSDALAMGYAYGDPGSIATLDGMAAGVVGSSCPDFAAGLQAGLAAGDPVAIATLDGMAAGTTLPGMPAPGYTCTQYGDAIEGLCIESIGSGVNMYLMNPDPAYATWSYFVTYNAVSYGLSGDPAYLADDSAVDFDPTCYSTGAPCQGRLAMVFTPTCVNEVEAREIYAEFVSLENLCDATGDVNGDGAVNVTDIVQIVQHVLGGEQLGGVAGCQANVGGNDDIINVIDIVTLVNWILYGAPRTADMDATEATLLINDNHVSIESDGYIGGIDMVVEFSGSDLAIDFAANDVADYVVNDDNTARIIIASSVGIQDVLNVTAGTITSVKEMAVVTSDGDSYIVMDDSAVEFSGTPNAFSVGTAYPNPFNPSTNLSLELNTTADISVKVFNIMGQLVDVIAEGNYSPNTYNWTWDAENLASGVYLVRTQVGNNVDNQKVMLLK